METIFMKVIEMSVVAACLIAVVIILRFPLKKGPKWFMGAPWSVVALRLILPFQIESRIGILPNFHGIITVFIYERFQWIWLAGVAIVLIYMGHSYYSIKKQTEASVQVTELGDNVYKCDEIDTPFILGIFNPKIYLPSGLENETITNVLAHERAHIRRGDHIKKQIGFLLLAIHWFNPLVWISYALFCKDLELSCDEKVISRMSLDEKKSYATSLLRCSTNQRYVFAYQLAFGGIGVGTRVNQIFNYKKASGWLIMLLTIITLALSTCFFTSSAQKGLDLAVAEDEENAEPVVEFQDTDEVPEEEMVVETSKVIVKFPHAASQEVVVEEPDLDTTVYAEWRDGNVMIMRGQELVASLSKQQIKQLYMAKGYTEAELSGMENLLVKVEEITDDGSGDLALDESEDKSELVIKFQLPGKEGQTDSVRYVILRLFMNGEDSRKDKPEFAPD